MMTSDKDEFVETSDEREPEPSQSTSSPQSARRPKDRKNRTPTKVDKVADEKLPDRFIK